MSNVNNIQLPKLLISYANSWGSLPFVRLLQYLALITDTRGSSVSFNCNNTDGTVGTEIVTNVGAEMYAFHFINRSATDRQTSQRHWQRFNSADNVEVLTICFFARAGPTRVSSDAVRHHLAVKTLWLYKLRCLNCYSNLLICRLR